MARHIRFVLLIFLLAGSASAQPAPPGNRIDVNGQPLWVSGTNVAWIDFARDLGPGGARFSEFHRMFRELRANGGNTIRFWMHTTGAHTPVWNGTMVTGPGPNALQNLKTLLDIAESYDVVVLLSLWSFDMLRTTNGETILTRSHAILTQQANRDSYIQQSLIPMVNHVKGHRAILAWEIFNEAEGMSQEFGWSSITSRHVPMADIQAFVNQTTGAIKRTDPSAQVTTGIVSTTAMSDIYTANNPLHRNYYRDDRLVAAGGDPLGVLDFYTFHYYGHGDSPFSRPASYFELDKPVFVGEFFLKGDTEGVPKHLQYKRIFDNGYAGALSWQWIDWANNRDNNTATWPNTLPNLRHMYARHTADVELNLAPKAPTYQFATDLAVIEAGLATNLYWRTRNVATARLNGEPVYLMEDRTIAPAATTVYVLELIGHDGSVIRDTITITVVPNLEVDRAVGAARVVDPSGRWMYIEMDASYGIQKLELVFDQAPSGGLTLETGFDGHTWSVAYEGSATDIPFTEPRHARFVRVLTDGASDLASIRLFGLKSTIQPPKLDITQPSDGAVIDVESVVSFSANAVVGTSGFGTTGVRFYGNDALLASKRFAPWNATWIAKPEGEYVVQAWVNTVNFPNFRSRPITIRVVATQENRRFEAETAVRTGTISIGSDAAASGGQYVNMSADGLVRWMSVPVATTKRYTIRIGYNLPYSEKTQYLRVNGVVTDTIVFGGPTQAWQFLERPIDLQAGNNTIEILHFWGYMWFDYIEIRGDGQTTDIHPTTDLPAATRLEQNYPNPFNPSTEIRWMLDAGRQTRLAVYDVLGREVAVLADGVMPAGEHRVTFDARGLSSGIYLYRLETGGQTLTRRMILIQ